MYVHNHTLYPHFKEEFTCNLQFKCPKLGLNGGDGMHLQSRLFLKSTLGGGFGNHYGKVDS